MPVYIYDKDAFEKMVLVEGEEYRRCKSKKVFDNCSFDAFIEEWRRTHTRPLWWYRLRKWLGVPYDGHYLYQYGSVRMTGTASIYGSGGWNRYGVDENGEIRFLRFFAIEKDEKTAQKIGFRLNG